MTSKIFNREKCAENPWQRVHEAATGCEFGRDGYDHARSGGVLEQR